MEWRKTTCAILAMAMLTTVCASTGALAYTGHSPVRIDSNGDFSGIASSGNGTSENPWVIEGMEIDGEGYGYCIYVGNTTDYFVIQYNHLYGAETQDPDNYYRPNAGISLYNVENGAVMRNEIEYNLWIGIQLYASCGNVIQYNNVTNNECGIYLLDGSDGNEISYNYASFNLAVGIASDYSDYTDISYNTADNNTIGIYVIDSHYCEVAQNLLFYNEYGLYFEDAVYNTALNNSISLSTGCGAYVDDNSYYNEIYHNNFGNNAMHACDDGAGTSWDAGYPDGGNFWTGYNGTDEYSGEDQDVPGSDGIGDTPYAFEGDQDGYPLMEPVDTYGIGRRDDPTGIGRRDDPT